MSERTPTPADLAIVGLGRIGGGLALQAAERGLRVVGHSRRGPSAELRAAGVTAAGSLDALRERLAPPRRVLLYLPAGPAVDGVLDTLLDGVLAPGDVVADGGNAYWGDSVRRARRLAERGLGFVDLGTSGGVDGARHGACFMAGGEAAYVSLLEPLLRRLAVDGGFVHAGPSGAGHFVKLVHNGIEFGMLQAIGEGVALLTRRGDLAVDGVLQAWRHGSVIRSWLIDLMAAACAGEPPLHEVPPVVEDTGEVNWLLQDALAFGVPLPVISQSVQQLVASRDHHAGGGDAARAVALMRRGFGGHPLGRDEAVARGRATSRVGDLVDPAATDSPGPSAGRGRPE